MGYGYDANGNITQRVGQRYSFDIGNRLRAAAGKASYGYDGHGRRTFVSYADGSWKLQVYSLGGQLLFTRHSREGDTRHISLGAVLIAEHNSATGVRYAHTDALGSPVAWTNGAGQLLSRTRYEPYGATAGGTNPTGVGYTGHVNDADTGLVYMQQRYYDPVAGRFLSVDPVVTDANTGGQFERYAYALNSPLRFVDPDGLDARDDQVNRQLDESRRSACGVSGCDGGYTEPSGKAWGSRLPGTTAGDSAAMYWADRVVSSEWYEDPIARVGLGLAVLWTPDTALTTATTLIPPVRFAAVAGAVGKGAARAGVTHAHHAWPKYLGGPKVQDLQRLPKSVHDAYHSGLDKILPRQCGTTYYENLGPAARQQMQRDLTDYTKAFDSKNGTQLYDSMIRNGFPGP